MTKVEMMAKLKRNKGIGVEITTATWNMIYYFYEDFEDSKLFKNDTNIYNFLTSVINSEVDITIWFLSKNKDFRFDINTKPYRYMILENEKKVKMLYDKIYEEFKVRNYDPIELINNKEFIKKKKVLK